MNIDLNNYQINTDGHPLDQEDYSVRVSDCELEVLSNTATKSLENTVIIHSKKVAQAYFNEWAQITALSEPLDWESEWSAPEWRIGT